MSPCMVDDLSSRTTTQASSWEKPPVESSAAISIAIMSLHLFRASVAQRGGDHFCHPSIHLLRALLFCATELFLLFAHLLLLAVDLLLHAVEVFLRAVQLPVVAGLLPLFERGLVAVELLLLVLQFLVGLIELGLAGIGLAVALRDRFGPLEDIPLADDVLLAAVPEPEEFRAEFLHQFLGGAQVREVAAHGHPLLVADEDPGVGREQGEGTEKWRHGGKWLVNRAGFNGSASGLFRRRPRATHRGKKRFRRERLLHERVAGQLAGGGGDLAVGREEHHPRRKSQRTDRAEQLAAV